jgi:predicted component of type VI protein secretion system
MYRFLLRIAGALCTFSTEYLITDFPVYDHRNLGGCLFPVAAQVSRMLETMSFRKRRCQVIAFQPVDSPRDLKVELSPKLLKDLGEKPELYLAFSDDAGGRTRNADEFVKVLGGNTIAKAETLPGLELVPISYAPADCAKGVRKVYFQITKPTVDSTTVSRITTSGAQGRTQTRALPNADLLPWRLEIWEDIIKNKEVRLYFIDSGAVTSVQLLAVAPQAR